MKVVDAIQNNKILNQLGNSMMALMPVLMVGAIFSLISGLPLGEGYTNFLNNTGLAPLLQVGVNVSQFMGLFVVFSLAYHIAKDAGQDGFTAGILGLISFLIVTPMSVNYTNESGATFAVTGAIPTSWLGAQGMFSGIIIGLIVGYLFVFTLKKNLKIKMPEQVPEFVAKSFEGIIPGLIIGVLFIAVRGLFSLTEFGNIHAWIYGLIQSPLMKLSGNLGAMVIILLITQILWWFGIHGTLTVLPIAMILYQPQALLNLQTFMAGQPIEKSPTTILTFMFFFVFVQFLGGPGCMLGLGIDMVAFAKSERYKAMGKLSIVPVFFNIIEPIIYGFPIVMNPIMLVPFLLTPVVFSVVGYYLMLSGLVGIPVVMLSVMTIPGPIVGFLLGGGISLGIMLIVMVVISTLIYFPFFKISDTKAYKEEQEIAAQLEAENEINIVTV